MRRGLLGWSPEEIGQDVFEGRVRALQSAMREQGIDVLLAYTDFTRPAAVSRITHFIPYWARGVMVLKADDDPRLVCALSNRVGGWIKETSTLDDVVCGPDIGGGLAERLPSADGNACQVGVVELSTFPRDIAESLQATRRDVVYSDATTLFESALQDDGEPGVIERKAADIAAEGLAAAEAAKHRQDANALIAAAEGAMRRAGAEEVLIALAPDMAADPRFRRVEGDVDLGAVFALQLSVAYKGFWVRRGRTFGVTAEPDWSNGADAAFDELLTKLGGGADPATAVDERPEPLAGWSVDYWRVEGPSGGLPLTVLLGSEGGLANGAGTVRPPYTFSLRLKHADGWWFGASPVGIGR